MFRSSAKLRLQHSVQRLARQSTKTRALLATVIAAQSFHASRTLLERKSSASSEESHPFSFDISDIKDTFKKALALDDETTDAKDDDKRHPDTIMAFQQIAAGFMSLISGNEQAQNDALVDLVAQARDKMQKGELHDNLTIEEVFELVKTYVALIKQVADKYVGDIDLSKLTPTTFIYYLEREDERKNPSWKARIHRFCSTIDIDKVDELNRDLELALLAYADTVSDIEKGLGGAAVPADLVYANVDSAPGEPAHYVAIPRNQETKGFMAPPLEVIMGVRGTKSIADAITDILCDSERYRGGKAHGYILKGGKFLFEKHRATLEEICRKAGRSKIKLKLVGHSLGAGAASIAGIEFNELSNFEVEVVGFGCPACLSKDLAEKSTFITTVVNDSDAIPRCSAATITNLLLNLVEFDWIPYSQRDIDSILKALKTFNSTIFSDDAVRKIRKTITPLIREHFDHLIERDVTNRITPEIFVPGQVIHIYRDGVGMAGCYVPNTFFSEIDVTRRMAEGRSCQ
ncbi:hypothetical protein FisN_6Lh348 [Fistulifera solaris]|uniref:Fungal lipase-type domain-containing protein n=1 Tax=Fistulifera solaris TaxID=1519565 RepID=A0A1Z5JKM9_FISSO|nr:hypothetical protein FisN_6Lh348 [Fistulifera solaris]|eukprot:GAX14570.1 hypothetical protein FisN_6Lh348 [Fistulifera solaris]